ncbi:hypothetical protein [Aquipseudomonas alcaligenes]|uniref:hypothetical protein n=1 Tax=Aquipseudomonas alcaligenes TaxID=43263 RepID=UPI0011159B97|nr:hypothetical protein [Pseudomonas alcaligenes]
MDEITKGILVGAGGTILSGVLAFFFSPIPSLIINYIESKRIYTWLKNNSSEKSGDIFRSTRAIASHCNLTEERVRVLCSSHKKIFLSTGQKEDMWSIHSRKSKSTFG